MGYTLQLLSTSHDFNYKGCIHPSFNHADTNPNSNTLLVASSQQVQLSVLGIQLFILRVVELTFITLIIE